MALNIGDFLVEHFISDDLLGKISDRIGQDSQKLIRQLVELTEIYSVEKTLGILGGAGELTPESKTLIHYDDIAHTLTKVFQVDQCQIFLKGQSVDQLAPDNLILVGTSSAPPPEIYEAIHFSTQAKSLLVDAYLANDAAVYDVTGKDRLNWKPFSGLYQEKVHTMLACPLRDGRKPLGLLLLESHTPCQFTPEVMTLAKATAKTFVTASLLHQLLMNTEHTLENFSGNHNELVNLRAQITDNIADLGIHQHEFLQALSNAVDSRHAFSQGHSQRIAEIARTLAESMHLNEKTADLLYYAGCLSALGKLNLTDEILTKKEALSTEERTTLQGHTQSGADLLGRIHFLSEVIPYLSTYLERWDGSGGPNGLSGRSIPLGSRVLSVANCYVALTGERPYRSTPLTHQEALAVLKEEAGHKWDPQVVEAFSKIPADSL